ncbi:serine hydrolase domain-containing protein [Candidatus Poriferisodalis sp.]|uniref:serine hydrolase domain-containing protein n=1 Tax=Candidatus Poriferisodalis sp. TaxID=3101277 RepID=UPI003AF45302
MKRLACVLLGLGLLAAACSSTDDTSPDTASDGTAQAPATEAAAPTTTAAPATTAASETTAAPAPTTQAPAPATTAASTPKTTKAAEPAAEPIDRLSAAVLAWMDETGAPGVVLAVTRGGAEPLTFAWGVSDLATDTPMTPDHHVRIGSVTKAVTAAVVLQLVAEGRVEFDAPVAHYLGDDWAPGYEHAATVTVRDLLGHTSGFVEFAVDPRFFQLAAPRLNEPMTPEEILEFAAAYGPVADLGTERHYNTTGYVAAGLLIEAVTDNPAADEMRARVFDPLGLSHTYLTPSEFPPEPNANGYVGGTFAYVLGPILGLTGDNKISLQGAIYVDIGTMPQELARSAGWTGGGIEARIGDVALLIRGLFAGDILDASQIALMTTGHPDPADNNGLGINTDEVMGLTVHSHGGGVPGFRTIAAYVPAFDLGIAINANLLGIDADNDVDDLLVTLAPILVTMG